MISRIVLTKWKEELAYLEVWAQINLPDRSAERHFMVAYEEFDRYIVRQGIDAVDFWHNLKLNTKESALFRMLLLGYVREFFLMKTRATTIT